MTTKWRIACAAAVCNMLAILNAPGTQAASRFGGTTDDSVCDVGRTDQRTHPNVEAFEFIQTQCKNGQLLMGSSVVPASGSASEIEGLAKRYCRIADIQMHRSQGSMGGIMMEFDEARCKIEKIKNSK